MQPFLIKPAYHAAIWGGQRMREALGMTVPFEKTGECWAVSAHPAGVGEVASGPMAGKKLDELFREHPEVLGGGGEFPILAKILDASDVLSVQVHPDDEYAARVEHTLGKREAWLIIDAPPGAELILGVKPGTDRETFRRAIEENRLEAYLLRRKVAPGDVLMIPPGTVHAIGRGILLYEIQQASDVVYRVYDWGRLENGKPRELHVDKALDVIDFDARPPEAAGVVLDEAGCQRRVAIAGEAFALEVLEISGRYRREGDSFFAFTCLGGEGHLVSGEERLLLEAGDSVFIPAGAGVWGLEGHLWGALVYLPDRAGLRAELMAKGASSEELGKVCGLEGGA
ncbi:type I phosphomannose isomerase catalytic subunit [Gehongia tenuis]|uniref:Phosphohexomutase n=1 Tax=Gehongia tenuis TaxID=2763655 RepID=A0A926D2R6_9FIRM|nr:type I phosphomannose isomerase catalytic subunit [Gehongia tenuis]MBC8530409.1 class I mannose-6-phosphate isomerase [Gehongia tenuis]